MTLKKTTHVSISAPSPTVLHMIGCDADRDSQFAYIEHLRKAFKMEPKRHLELFEAAEARPKPRTALNLTIAEARNLATKDISGLNDPFCTVYVRSSRVVTPQVRTRLALLQGEPSPRVP